ncbi:hypothetical protein CO057_02285 [Candidatus Uhrbacteria bacterium CG_4_9_14_0_2_um_filter_41_50]|uniref:Uncharacterized protein n=1 Tax=Candidatus Uhrbacteria bacterium CG_4_9_14_0_2_um_filter_41_50 TaxID=1975031 RepID=A0A2M8EP76_9BACT|nr:MAG: hypothetical protein COZ45_03085 [Candidatus Uhrbacteria bacterium CG_4_10_14_3_um_filter_41_21]PIZ55452.1 MAG: hypothetical protein COY24_00280 [Candidatus Uhrbacteria bacterium CG_4_10_14_0_2_um_filter_41_21]PJB84633.1 MAG: hypothetical protein CO086_02635 [Candidatus Uhrbacteria bacterium CG_4_9_14_0_8_um_filter_41_16]PJC24538.1 MAG: hypothetical protein CO057_02285 [Candidatus Uhrbacteria bacterium CG_4_9_14_0_2_um_filter_41_50]PJE75387.1 MAG: hypothetical protein COV03_00435 [Candi
MTYSFSRVLTAAAIGMLLLMPVFGMTTLNVQTAHAQQLETDDFFDEDFTDSTGLGQADLKSTIGNLIRVFLGFLGIIAVVMVLLGGFKWMTASGNDEKVQDAKKLLVAGIVGLAIILSAYAITTFVISSIIDASA